MRSAKFIQSTNLDQDRSVRRKRSPFSARHLQRDTQGTCDRCWKAIYVICGAISIGILSRKSHKAHGRISRIRLCQKVYLQIQNNPEESSVNSRLEDYSIRRRRVSVNCWLRQCLGLPAGTSLSIDALNGARVRPTGDLFPVN